MRLQEQILKCALGCLVRDSFAELQKSIFRRVLFTYFQSKYTSMELTKHFCALWSDFIVNCLIGMIYFEQNWMSIITRETKREAESDIEAERELQNVAIFWVGCKPIKYNRANCSKLPTRSKECTLRMRWLAYRKEHSLRKSINKFKRESKSITMIR